MVSDSVTRMRKVRTSALGLDKRIAMPEPQEEMVTSRAWTHAPAPAPQSLEVEAEEPRLSPARSSSSSSSPYTSSSAPSSLSANNGLGDGKLVNGGAETTETTASGREGANNNGEDSSRAGTFSPTAQDDDRQRAAVAVSSSTCTSTTLTQHNTWITSTTVLPAGSMTIKPFASLLDGDGGGNGGKQTALSAPFAPTSTSMSISSQGTFSVTAPVAADNLQPATLAGTSAVAGGAGNVAGVSVASAIAALVIAIAVIVYVRGGVLRGFIPHVRAKRTAPLVDQNQENAHRRDEVTDSDEAADTTAYDLEKVASSSLLLAQGPQSHYVGLSNAACEQDQWEEIDVHDSRSGVMEQDNGEWLEAWRRRKEALMGASRHPPELQFNPALPLPPISLDSGKADAGANK